MVNQGRVAVWGWSVRRPKYFTICYIICPIQGNLKICQGNHREFSGKKVGARMWEPCCSILLKNLSFCDKNYQFAVRNFLNTFGTEARIFQKYVTNMDANALKTYITRPPASMVLTLRHNQINVFYSSIILTTCTLSGWEVIEKSKQVIGYDAIDDLPSYISFRL